MKAKFEFGLFLKLKQCIKDGRQLYIYYREDENYFYWQETESYNGLLIMSAQEFPSYMKPTKKSLIEIKEMKVG